MSIAPREAKCLSSWNCRPGQPPRLGHIVKTRPSGLTVGVPHDGHVAGGRGGGLRSGLSTACGAGDSTCGMTSPARRTMTSSPTRRSLRRRSSSLCSVASLTVTPPTCTGSRTAKGCRSPNLPTFHSMPFSVVIFVVGGNFQGIPTRGARPPPPGGVATPDAEAALPLVVVDLADAPVDLELERASTFLPLPAAREDLLLGG